MSLPAETATKGFFWVARISRVYGDGTRNLDRRTVKQAALPREGSRDWETMQTRTRRRMQVRR